MSSLVQAQAPAAPREKRHEFSLSRQRVELDTFTVGEITVGGSTSPEFDVRDFEQTLTRVSYRYGGRSSGFIVSVVGEELDDDPNAVTLDLVGFEVGTDGFPHLGSSSPVAAAIDYGIGLSLRFGNDDSTIFGGATETDIVLAEIAARIGAGVDFNGLRVSGGLNLSAIGAVFDNDVVDEPFEGSASNAGPYLRIWFKGDQFPMTGGIQLMGGDIRGANIGVGIHF